MNDLLIPEDLLRSGVYVEFEIEDGERGSKASSVRLAEGAGTAPARPAGPDAFGDTRTEQEFLREVTDVLLESVSSLTGEQIVRARRALLAYGRQRGWIEDASR